MTIFISQPMGNKTKKEILEERDKLIDLISSKETNPVFLNSFYSLTNETPLWYLGRAIQILSKADKAYFAPDWQNHRGCRIEYECALEYGIPVVEL